MAAYSVSDRRFMRGEEAPWIDEIRSELEAIHLRALECYAMNGLAIGGHENPIVAQAARRLVDLAPYRETGYRLWIQALERE